LNKSPKQSANSFDLEALEPRVLLSADAFLATATLAATVHKSTEAAHHASALGHGTLQDNLAYHPVEAGGIFDGVATQAIHSHKQAPVQSITHVVSQTAPVTATTSSQNSSTEVQAKTVSAVAVSTSTASPTAKISSASTTLSATSTTALGSVAKPAIVASLNAANAPPAFAVNAQLIGNKSVASIPNISTSSASSSFSPAVSPNNQNTADLYQTILADITAINGGGMV
jgi:hypothetical protein